MRFVGVQLIGFVRVEAKSEDSNRSTSPPLPRSEPQWRTAGFPFPLWRQANTWCPCHYKRG
jgi:hypothetical protein